MILMAMIEGGEQYEYTALLVTDAVRALALCRGPLPVPKLFAPAFVEQKSVLACLKMDVLDTSGSTR